MGIFNFWRKTPTLTLREREIIKNAHKSINNERMFRSLYFPLGDLSNFRKYGYDSQDKAVNEKMEHTMAEFLKNSNYFVYVIFNSEDLYERLKGHASEDVLNSLGGLTTLAYRLNKKEYIIRKNKDVYYPAALCEDTPEKTSARFINLFEPLLKL
jgi:hypothetical protein